MKQAYKRVLAVLLVVAVLRSFPVAQSAGAVPLDTIVDGLFFVVDTALCGKEIIEGDTGLQSCYDAVYDIAFFFLPYAVNTGSKIFKQLSIGGRTISKADDVFDIYKSCDTISDLTKAGFSVIDSAEDLKIGNSIFGKYEDLVKLGSKGGTVEMHHLNPQSLSGLFGRTPNEMLATAWSTEFHRLGADQGKITQNLNALVNSVKKITGGSNAYSHAAFAKYIGGIGKVYKEGGIFYSGMVMLDALASPGGLKWLQHLGLEANIIAKALNHTRDAVVASAADTKNTADTVIAQAMVNSLYDSTNDAFCVQFYNFLTGKVEMGEDVTEQFAGKKLRLKSVESGGYVCGENNTTVHTCCGENAGVFEAVLTEDNWLGLRLENGYWLSVQDNGYLRTTASELQAWECFKIFQYGGDYFLYSQKNDCYVQVADEVTRNLRTERGAVYGVQGASWERFAIEEVTSSSGTASAGKTAHDSTSGGRTSDGTYVENRYYQNPKAIYTEGYYTGEWSNGAPNGYGTIVFVDEDGDGKRYSLSKSSGKLYATCYEGYFVNGFRYGQGIVCYEGGYRDDGIFYGAWAADKLVFEGKRWYVTDQYNGYWPVSIVAASTTSPKSETYGDWVSMKTTYSIVYDANGGSNAPASQKKDRSSCLTLSYAEPYRSGYIFRGWAESSNGIVSYQPGDSYSRDESVTLYAIWEEIIPVLFDDVRETDYFYDAVIWAGRTNITQGTTTRTFLPDAACTRGQAVTFLWRAAGSPCAVSSNPFTDVKPGDYFYEAVLWAMDNGIVQGCGGDIFAPQKQVTRAQFATMLYRYAGCEMVFGSLNFVDVPRVGYYADAVIWCDTKNITNGTSYRTFSPNQACTRAQIVTFLYRYKLAF